LQFLVDTSIILASYLFGSVPFGLLVVRFINGKDIRTVASGRTGGTNAFRAAGLGAGIFTALLDILKAALTVWLAKYLSPNIIIHILAPVAAVLGHNHSIFLPERNDKGHLRLRGGAGGAAAFGGTIGLWPPAAFFMLPVGILLWWGVGYASVTTLSVGLITMLIFTIRAMLDLSPWVFVLYGFLVQILLTLALLPNLRNLRAGTERRHGLPVILQKRKIARLASSDPKDH
jgi:acyl phosphate:glycerol-3-phosphate acyltransferase